MTRDEAAAVVAKAMGRTTDLRLHTQGHPGLLVEVGVDLSLARGTETVDFLAAMAILMGRAE